MDVMMMKIQMIQLTAIPSWFDSRKVMKIIPNLKKHNEQRISTVRGGITHWTDENQNLSD
jgi:hypothetical protein